MKKLVLTILTISLLLVAAGCGCESGEAEMEVRGLEITVNQAYFGQVAGWDNLVVELTLRNTDKEAHFLHFSPIPNVYLQSGDDTYKNLKACSRLEGEDNLPKGEMDNITVDPGETEKVVLRFWDVPENKELKLVYSKPGEDRASVSVSVRPSEVSPAEEEDDEVSAAVEESSEPEQLSEGVAYYSAPKNPETPGETVAAFYFLVSDQKGDEAEKYVAASDLEEYRLNLPKMESYFESFPVQKVVIHEDQPLVIFSITLADKGSVEGEGKLVKEDGRWKISQEN